MRLFTLLSLIAIGVAGCSDGAVNVPVSTRETPANNVDQTTTVRTGDLATDRDNTAINERDRVPAAKTPIDQNENQKDVSLTADIRKRVVDTDMSVNAHNVKIITQDGRVTLRGPVKSAEEKQAIEAIAIEIAGGGNVTNQLEVEVNP
jgi:hyperosmotically inducible protein